MSESPNTPPLQPTPTPPPVPAPPKIKGMSTGCIVTLVLGIVALVFTILVPLAMYVISNAHTPSARVQMKGLEVAIWGYRTEYNRLPSMYSPPPAEDNTQGYNTTAAEGKQLLEILMATDTSKNPRHIRFYEPPAAKKGVGYTHEGGLVDIWGSNGYIIIFDYSGDGVIADPEHPGAKLPASVIIYSAGRDLDFSTWDDNLTSWKH